MSLINSKDVVMDYDERTRALNGIDIQIPEGEWVMIMGPSGSGKTTLLNIIGCLDSLTGGKVEIDSTDITLLNAKQLTRFRRENIGFIFQQFHLVPYLTALENVMLSQFFVNDDVDEDAALAALERVGMQHRADHVPAHMSGGEQQRVAVARALANNPKILLADEPTGNLDQKNGKLILELLRSLHEEGHTIVLITHDPNVAAMGERIVTLVDGKIVNDTRTNGGIEDVKRQKEN
jgi:putative ABC transport system ATP-binding protein